MEEYKTHMTENAVKQGDSSELIFYLLDEYEVEGGETINIDV